MHLRHMHQKFRPCVVGILLAVLVAWADADVNELPEAACVEGAGLG